VVTGLIILRYWLSGYFGDVPMGAKTERLLFSLNFKVATSSTLVLLIAGTVAFSL